MLIRSQVNYGLEGTEQYHDTIGVAMEQTIKSMPDTYNNLVSVAPETTSEAQTTTSENNSTNKKQTIMEKLKAWVISKPLMAIGITIAVGMLLGHFIGKKLFTGKKSW